ncbi:unnamed protein product [Protopolystoma xenopodis]|uniref:Uncharacterized protein n=1 Tax=Protopolystoma xenopodis TaxID=117903 RepID=A0A448XM05_9PLAT|nr:unnamed protein product [Protopolystoma xenopodis]
MASLSSSSTSGSSPSAALSLPLLLVVIFLKVLFIQQQPSHLVPKRDSLRLVVISNAWPNFGKQLPRFEKVI